MFSIYDNVLKTKSCIIIDAEPKINVSNFLLTFYYYISGRILKSVEESTYEKIKKVIKKSQYINNTFEIDIVGEGVSRIAIFRKK